MLNYKRQISVFESVNLEKDYNKKNRSLIFK